MCRDSHYSKVALVANAAGQGGGISFATLIAYFVLNVLLPSLSPAPWCQQVWRHDSEFVTSTNENSVAYEDYYYVAVDLDPKPSMLDRPRAKAAAELKDIISDKWAQALENVDVPTGLGNIFGLVVVMVGAPLTFGVVKVRFPKIRRPPVQHVLIESEFVSRIFTAVHRALGGPSGRICNFSVAALTAKWQRMIVTLKLEAPATVTRGTTMTGIGSAPDLRQAGGVPAWLPAIIHCRRTLRSLCGVAAGAATPHCVAICRWGAYHPSFLQMLPKAQAQITAYRGAWKAFWNRWWELLGPLDRGTNSDAVAFGGSSDRAQTVTQRCPPAQLRFPDSLSSWYLGWTCDTSGDYGSFSAMLWVAVSKR